MAPITPAKKTVRAVTAKQKQIIAKKMRELVSAVAPIETIIAQSAFEKPRSNKYIG